MVTVAKLEQLAQEQNFAIKEHQLDIYYSSLKRTYTETFVTIMDGEKPVVEFNAALLEDWIPEWLVVEELDKYKKVQL
jgi:hypothetical protein